VKAGAVSLPLHHMAFLWLLWVFIGEDGVLHQPPGRNPMIPNQKSMARLNPSGGIVWFSLIRLTLKLVTFFWFQPTC